MGDFMPNIHSTISFALVNIPVVMNPLIKNNDTSFNQLHKKCLNRIKYLKYCPHCQKNVLESEIIKGYEYEKGEYLTFEKSELNKLKPINEKEIEIISFVLLSEIEPTFFEKSYLLETENKSKAYLLFCEALKKTKRVALAKTVLGTKFYYCILRFTEFGIILTTLYFHDEVKFPEHKVTGKVNEKELNLAIQLVDSLKGHFEPEKYKDEYQTEIKKAINDKLNGKTVKGTKRKNKTQISDLMKALEKSLKENK